MKKIFNKQDMAIVPRWTDNIKDEWINPLISSGCELGFRDTISSTMYDAIAAQVTDILAGTQGEEWTNQAYAQNDIVLFDDEMFKADAAILINAGNPDANAHWVKQELITFWHQFAKPYLIYYTYRSFLIWHGKHISMGGIRKHTDNTSFEINAEELGYILGEVKVSVSTKKTKMLNKLTDVAYTFDTIKYTKNENSKDSQTSSVRIFSV